MEGDPNEFIIKNEVFVRDWDGLYGSIPDPWSQEKESGRDVSLHLALQLLTSYSRNSTPPPFYFGYRVRDWVPLRGTHQFVS